MIITLTDTTTGEIAKALVPSRERGGQLTTSRVLTLIVVADMRDDLASVTQAITEASREHPSRVIVLATGDPECDSRIDAEIRVGGNAGAAEMIIMHLRGEVSQHLVHVVTPLLLPDTPIVAWWPFLAPIVPARDPIGAIAERRITDSLADPPNDALYNRRTYYVPGDSDFAWARLTPWRGIISSLFDQPLHTEITGIRVYGAPDDPSVDLAAGWLADRLNIPITRMPGHHPSVPPRHDRFVFPVSRFEVSCPKGTIVVRELDNEDTLGVEIPGRPTTLIAISKRSNAECLAEELRHLDPDNAYASALSGLDKVVFH